MMKRTFFLMACATVATTAHADLRVEFREGAPKDRFIVTNTGACVLGDTRVTIDLSQSTGGLIFDVTDQGAGVEVFQPLEIEAGAQFLTATPVVKDGQTQVTFDLAAFEAGSQIIVSTDLDDTIGAREITVRGTEFDGTTLTVAGEGADASATFQGSFQATAVLNRC